jgi:hypothetical protein
VFFGIDNAAIFHGNDAICDAKDTRIMRHKQDRGTAFAGETLDQRRNLVPGDLIERRGRLVGKHEVWISDQRTGDRHTLLLATGQLGWRVIKPLPEPDGRKHGSRRSSRSLAAEFHRHRGNTPSNGCRDQLRGKNSIAHPLL